MPVRNSEVSVFLSLCKPLGCVVIGAALVLTQQKESSPPQAGQPVFPGLMDNINDVSELVVQAQTGTITIVRKGKA